MEETKKIKLAAPPIVDSVVDGPGLRIVLFTQFCPHRCKGCHNPETWSLNGGEWYSVDEIINLIKEHPEQTGITFSGGEPLMQSDVLRIIAKAAKGLGKSVWCYTGFILDYYLMDEEYELLKYVDVLVDSPFEIDKKSDDCKWRGSTNQRLIDVQKTLQQEEVVLWTKDL